MLRTNLLSGDCVVIQISRKVMLSCNNRLQMSLLSPQQQLSINLISHYADYC